MDKADAIGFVKQYAEILKKHYDNEIKKVVLFGSYAGNTAKVDSDIDVAVVFNSVDGDFLTTEAKLFRLRMDIDRRIEPVLVEESSDRGGFLEDR